MLEPKMIFENIMKDLLTLYDLPKDYSSMLYYLAKKHRDLPFIVDKDMLLSAMTRTEISCTAIKCLKDLSRVSCFIEYYEADKMKLADDIYKVFKAVKNNKKVSIIISYKEDVKTVKLEYENE